MPAPERIRQDSPFSLKWATVPSIQCPRDLEVEHGVHELGGRERPWSSGQEPVFTPEVMVASCAPPLSKGQHLPWARRDGLPESVGP